MTHYLFTFDRWSRWYHSHHCILNIKSFLNLILLPRGKNWELWPRKRFTTQYITHPTFNCRNAHISFFQTSPSSIASIVEYFPCSLHTSLINFRLVLTFLTFAILNSSKRKWPPLNASARAQSSLDALPIVFSDYKQAHTCLIGTNSPRAPLVVKFTTNQEKSTKLAVQFYFGSPTSPRHNSVPALCTQTNNSAILFIYAASYHFTIKIHC